MGCGRTHPHSSNKNINLFINTRSLSDDDLRSLFFRMLEFKANEQTFVYDLRCYNYPNLEPVLEKNGYLDEKDFVAFIKFFAQEEHWNVEITEESILPEFTLNSQNGLIKLESFIEYFISLTGCVFTELIGELKYRGMFIGNFFIGRRKKPEILDDYKKRLEILQQNSENIAEKLFKQSVDGGFVKITEEFFASLKTLSFQLPVERVTDNYVPLLAGFFNYYDENKDGKFDKNEFLKFMSDAIQESMEYIGI